MDVTEILARKPLSFTRAELDQLLSHRWRVTEWVSSDGVLHVNLVSRNGKPRTGSLKPKVVS